VVSRKSELKGASGIDCEISLAPRFSEVTNVNQMNRRSRFNGFSQKPLKRFINARVLVTTRLKRGANETGANLKLTNYLIDSF